jgi:hypothetical protein
MDNESIRALILINGGGAVALATALPTILDSARFWHLAVPMMVGVLVMAIGLVAAVVSNHFRRGCSLVYEQHGMRPPKGTLFGFALNSPMDCFASRVSFWLSVGAFLFAVGLIGVLGLCIVSRTAA